MSTCTLTVALLAAHTPFRMLHLKIFIPTPRLVADETACEGIVIVPFPDISDQVPAPTVGTFPFSTTVGLLMQMVCTAVALALVGTLSTCTVIKDTAVGQTPLVIVQARVLIPKLRLVTAVVAEINEEILALPVIISQSPLPDKGGFPVSTVVGLLMQSV